MNLEALNILNEVRKNSRKTLGEISAVVKSSITKIYRTIKYFEEQEIIRKYVTFINYSKLFYGPRLLVIFQNLNDEDIERISQNKFLNNLIKMHNNLFLADFLFVENKYMFEFLDLWKEKVVEYFPIQDHLKVEAASILF